MAENRSADTPRDIGPREWNRTLGMENATRCLDSFDVVACTRSDVLRLSLDSAVRIFVRRGGDKRVPVEPIMYGFGAKWKSLVSPAWRGSEDLRGRFSAVLGQDDA